MKKTGKKVLTIILSAATVLSGCGLNDLQEAYEQLQSAYEEYKEQAEESKESEKDKDKDQEKDKDQNGTEATGLPVATSTGGEEEIFYDPDLVPCVPSYRVEKDLANVTIPAFYNYMFGLDEYNASEPYYQNMRAKLEEQCFVVTPGGNDEFFDVYEDNRYDMFPSFVTVDSLMHTYHLYFSYLMKNTEKTYLAENLKTLSNAMLSEAEAQYEACKGTDWEMAATTNLAFFHVGTRLLDPSTPALRYEVAQSMSDMEYNRILDAKGIDTCQLSGLYEDYTQYVPRGYYEGDEELERYFRAMMWYGRIPFALDDPTLVKSAVLMTAAIERSGKMEWEGIYKVTSFFAGASDDPGFEEVRTILQNTYGDDLDVEKLIGNEAALEKTTVELKKIKLPSINSVPVEQDDSNIVPSFRFMGQRYTVDADIMQKLIYRAVKDNPQGEKRMLPDVLDSAAALGSEEAYKILEQQGDTQYENYTDNLTIMKDHFAAAGTNVWYASLYSGWLNTLRPLLEKKGEGYPSYMQSDAWARKNLETYAGSYAELKHDTILYSKQVMAEMGGGGDDEILDDRGYVDPQPVVYSRFAELAKRTEEGLREYGMLSDSAKEDLERLNEIALTLLTISEKELRNEVPTDDEFEFIRCYGGYLEHFWQEANKDKKEGQTLYYSDEAPCPVVADIATDPNGAVLEVGCGKADNVYVVFPIGDELHIGRGSVYSFYQFTVPIDQRMKDSEWIAMMNGGYLDENYQWIKAEEKPDQPAWTQEYRVKWRD